MKRPIICPIIGFIVVFVFVLFVLQPLPSLQAEDSTIQGKPLPHGLYSPMRISFGPDRNLLVSDYRTRMIMVVDKTANQVRRWFEVKGRPLGVAYLRGHIYVGNETLQCIEVYNPAGKSFKKNGVFNTVIKKPTDIAVDKRSGKVFVVDGYTKMVKVFTARGKLLGTIPATVADPQVPVNPTGIAVDPVRKEVLLSDYGDAANNISPRIQIFDFFGQYQDTIEDIGEINLAGSSSGLSTAKMGMGGGGWGWGDKPRFSRPQGLAVDGNGHIFMVDCYSAEIMVFNRDDHVQIKTIGGYGTEPGKMRLPLDIVRDDDSGDLFVTNNRLARIEIFRQGGIIQ